MISVAKVPNEVKVLVPLFQTSKAEILFRADIREETESIWLDNDDEADNTFVSTAEMAELAICICEESDEDALNTLEFTFCICPDRLDEALTIFVSTFPTAVNIVDVASATRASVLLLISLNSVPNEVRVRDAADHIEVAMLLVEFLYVPSTRKVLSILTKSTPALPQDILVGQDPSAALEGTEYI
jgi:hypothetical protein